METINVDPNELFGVFNFLVSNDENNFCGTSAIRDNEKGRMKGKK